MCTEIKEVKTSKKIPICPNCKTKYKIKRLDPCGEDGMDYPLLIKHDTDALCSFGVESYQNSISLCIKSVNEHIKSTFTWLK